MRDEIIVVHSVFVGYSLLADLIGWPLARVGHKRQFYLGLSAADLVFVVSLIDLTGGSSSPFLRALYVWVAVLAFYFGLRGGIVASTIALLVYAAFHLVSDVPVGARLTAVQAGGSSCTAR